MSLRVIYTTNTSSFWVKEHLLCLHRHVVIPGVLCNFFVFLPVNIMATVFIDWPLQIKIHICEPDHSGIEWPSSTQLNGQDCTHLTRPKCSGVDVKWPITKNNVCTRQTSYKKPYKYNKTTWPKRLTSRQSFTQKEVRLFEVYKSTVIVIKAHRHAGQIYWTLQTPRCVSV